MQGSRGLLMGFGKAKLVAPPVRKFAPSIKIQSQNPAPVVVNESESERSLSTAITDEIEPLPFLLNEMNKLTASAGVIAADCMIGGVESRGVVAPHKVHANELLALSIVTSNEVDDNITIIESSTNAVISPVDNGSNAFDGENITNADTMGATVAILIGGSKKPKIVPRPRISFSQPAISAEHVITRGPISGSDGDVAVLSDGVTNTHLKSIATPASSSSSSTGKRKDSQGDSSGSDDEDDNEDLYAAALTKRKRSGAANKKNPKSKGKVTVSRASKKGDTNSNTNTNTISPAISQTEIILPNRRVGKVLNVASEMVIAREMWSNIAENNVTGQTPNLIPEQSVDQIPKKKIVKRVRKNQIPLENSENTQPTKRKKVATKVRPLSLNYENYRQFFLSEVHCVRPAQPVHEYRTIFIDLSASFHFLCEILLLIIFFFAP